ncbi:hypothetical protein MUO74_09350 [Candidatus Bathyarchaeota archaeon]|nr:hypothetical protein [Candidatus Bathyarchaeota archaeon]
MVGSEVKAKIEFSDEELAQIVELVSEYFEVYGYDADSPSDKVLQNIYRKIKGEQWIK